MEEQAVRSESADRQGPPEQSPRFSNPGHSPSVLAPASAASSFTQAETSVQLLPAPSTQAEVPSSRSPIVSFEARVAPVGGAEDSAVTGEDAAMRVI